MRIFNAYIFLFFGLGLNYIFNIVVARYLGAAGFGEYSYAIYLFNIASLIAVFSFDQAAIKFIPQSPEESDQFRIAIQHLSFFSSLIVWVLFLIVCYFALSDDLKRLSTIFSLSIIPFVMITVNVAVLQAHHIVAARMAFRYLLEPVIKMLLFFILFYYLKSSEAPAWALLIALLVTNVAAIFFFSKKLAFTAARESKHLYSKILQFALPLCVTNIIGVVTSRLDLLILGVFVSHADLGGYSAAFQTAAIVAVILQGVETVYAPIFSQHIGSNNKTDLERDYQLSLRWTLIFSAPLLLLFIIYPEIVMIPFGHGFSDATSLLSILCFGHLFVLAIGGTSNTLLVLLGCTKEVFYISLLQVVLTVLSVCLGAKYFGAQGAAVAVAVSLCVISLIRGFIAWKRSDSNPLDLYSVKAILSFAVSLFVFWVSKSYLGLSGLILLPTLFLFLVITLGIHPLDREKLQHLHKRILLLMGK